MAAWELKRDHLTRYCMFGIDSADDIPMLPTSVKYGSGDLIQSTTCAINSIARASNGKNYILTGENKWIEYSRSDGGGGGDDIEPITDGEIDDLFGSGAIADQNINPVVNPGNDQADDNDTITNQEIDGLFGG